MVRLVLALLCSAQIAVAMADVPLGECHECEVTCFEDCALKYDREIIQMDMFLQTEAAPEKKNRTVELTNQYSECVVGNCPCQKVAAAKPEATGKAKQLKLMAEDKKKGQCAVGTMG